MIEKSIITKMSSPDPIAVKELLLSDIFMDNEFNCRGVINPVDVMELAKSIKTIGLVQPIVVQPYDKRPDKKYRIIMGHRRYKAHMINSIGDPNASKTIKAIIQEGLSDEEAIVLNLAENIQRQDLTILQEAKSVEKLKLHGWSEIQVAERINKSRGWVQVRFMLLELPLEIQEEANKNLLSQQEIRDLWTVMEHQGIDAAYEYVREIKDAKLTGKKKPPNPNKILANKKKNRKYPRTPQEIFEIMEIIQSKIGNSFATKMLAWAAGQVDDLSGHQALKEEFAKHGKTYMIPLALTNPNHALVSR